MSFKSAPKAGSPAVTAVGLALIAGFIFYASSNSAKAGNTVVSSITDKVFSSKVSAPEETILTIPHFTTSNAPVRVTSRSTLTSGQVYVVLDLAPSTGDQFASTYPDAVTPSVDSKGGVK